MFAASGNLNGLKGIQELAIEKSWTLVSYRLPGTKTTTHLKFTADASPFPDLASLNGMSGFVFAPFEISDESPLYLIQPELTLSGEEISGEIKDVILKKAALPNHSVDKTSNLPMGPGASRQEYMETVDTVRHLINGSPLDKVVLSRMSLEKTPDAFSASHFFQSLLENYPDAFVFMVHIPEKGIWFGASPEPLFVAREKSIYTVSLAGTRKFSSNMPGRDWGKKELHEQRLVTEYIETTFRKYGVDQYRVQGPVSHRAGKVEHLKTEFFIENSIQDRMLEFIADLHPTPSVCGLPKSSALDIIKKTENYDREYYTGFLGPLNMNGQTHLYVNLRSMKYTGENIIYYQGAGITAESDPSEEWQETCNKKRTMESIMETINKG